MGEEKQGVDGEEETISVLGQGGDVQIEQLAIDQEEERGTQCCTKGCGCSMQCSSQLSGKCCTAGLHSSRYDHYKANNGFFKLQ